MERFAIVHSPRHRQANPARRARPPAIADLPAQRLAATPSPVHAAIGTVPLGAPMRSALPGPLRTGMEQVSGVRLDDVAVYRNSFRPARLQAHAFAQGNEIHLAPGQDRHLPHELAHVVQQRQGRVPVTGRIGATALNDDAGLEAEADIMSAQATGTVARRDGDAGPVKADVASGVGPVDAVQRKISYNSGRFQNRKQLLAALEAIYDEDHHDQVLAQVEVYEEMGGHAMYASTVFDYIVYNLRQEGIAAKFAVTTAAAASVHGPRMPVRSNRKTPVDAEDANDTFNFSKVTLARGTLMDDEAQNDFHDRNDTNAQMHAEDGIREQVDDTLPPGPAPNHRFNLTLNNFFCSHQTTKKTKKDENCLDQMIDLQRERQFGNFHVYFKNTYGNTDFMTQNIKKLKRAGIKVSSFTNEEDKVPYHNDELDPHSEDEDQSKGSSSSSSVLGKRKTPPKKSRSVKPTPARKPTKQAELSEDEEEEALESARTPAKRGSGKKEVKKDKRQKRERSPSPGGARSERGVQEGNARKRQKTRNEPEVVNDVVVYYGHRFSPNTPGIADGGECFWDTMFHYGFSVRALQAAARRARVTYDEHVDARDITALLRELNAGRDEEDTVFIQLVTFDIVSLRRQATVKLGEGRRRLFVALFNQGEDGHYVPEL